MTARAKGSARRVVTRPARKTDAATKAFTSARRVRTPQSTERPVACAGAARCKSGMVTSHFVQAPPRVYLAGPDVFLRDPLTAAAAKKQLCASYGFVGVFPLDAEL